MPTFIIFGFIMVLAAIGSGCQSVSSTTTAANSANSNADSAEKVDPKPADVRPVEPPAQTDSVVGSLATPSEAYKTAYELRKKKDVEGLKKIMSDDIKEFLTMMGEAEKKSLDDMIREMTENPQADKAEVRNEKIKGDRAVLEYLTETGSWKTMDFEKVDGKWLLTFPKADKMDDREA
jgi:hypothetical protein